MCALLLPPIPEGVIGTAWGYPTKDYFLRGVGLSYSNPYGENSSAHSNLVDLVQY